MAVTHDLPTALANLERARILLEQQRARVRTGVCKSHESVWLLREMERAMWTFEKHVKLLEDEWRDSADSRVNRTTLATTEK